MIFRSLVIVGVLLKRRGRALRTPTTPRHNGQRLRLAAQNGVEAFFHKLLAHTTNRRRVGSQRLNDATVAPAFARFRNVCLQTDARLGQSLPAMLALAQHRLQTLALFPSSLTTQRFDARGFAAMIDSPSCGSPQKRITKIPTR
jgi:hypothetical protein